MAEYICVLNKDTIIIKPAKKTPILLRMIVLVFAMVCGLNAHRILCGTLLYYRCKRSGSGWFETLLNSHVNTLDKVYNLDWFTSASKNECSAAVGFKWMLNQGVMQHHKEIADYFNRRGISAIFLFRRNLLRRMVSVLANSYDRHAKLLNGTHKSHVHSTEEAETLAKYKPMINSTLLISDLKEVEITATKALEYFNSTRHIVLYYEDLIKNPTKLKDVQAFLGLPVMDLTSRQVKIHKGPLSDHV
ncbi:hypothetical protein NC652_018294 [Populus alba x Populus x berolinensis]|nr:hypothetical protein NC652_018294 [Populus alba x Populus x berolinensis]